MTDFIVPLDLKATNEAKRYVVCSDNLVHFTCPTYTHTIVCVCAHFLLPSLPQNMHKLYRHDCLKKEHVSVMFLRVQYQISLC